jgi:transmembrane sensor
MRDSDLGKRIEEFRRDMEPPWGDLRERRILRNIERQVQEGPPRSRASVRVLRPALAALLAVASLAIVYAAGLRIGAKRSATGPATSAPSTASIASAGALDSDRKGGTAGLAASPADGPEVRVLSDGSVLQLARGARVDLRGASDRRVELAQSSGSVCYVVSHVPDRSFVIVTAGVQVTVTGTVFTVAIEGKRVTVRVEQGHVRVASLRGEVELGPGDQISASSEEPAGDRAPEPSSAEAAGSSRTTRKSEDAPTVAANALLDRADEERRGGDFAAAAATLRQFLERYPKDRRKALAWFTLGRVERARDRAAVAAAAFRQCSALAAGGVLTEDALAEEAAAWAAAGSPAEAYAAAQRYLERFPNGAHVARMRRIAP